MAYESAAFAALSDPTRRRVLERLSLGPRAVGEIASGLPVSRPAVSQHLKVLKAAGLVSDRQDGARRIYAIDPHGLGASHNTSIFALYLDSEGHVIYYTVSTPDPHTAVFLSQGPSSAPKFRLTYHLEGIGPKAVMSGKFQMAAPGSDDFHSYLEWSGTKM